MAACSDSNNNEPALEADFEVTIENIGTEYTFIKSGSFSVPVGSSDPGPIGPGGAYEFEFTAPVGSRLSFATMFVQSNDWFYSPNESGIELFNTDGSQITGDITSLINLYDSGTEADEVPGEGVNQAPRQSGANAGAVDPDNTVRLVSDSNLPSTSDVLRVTLSSTSSNGFRVRIENVSSGSTLQTSNGSVAVPLAPGAWAVHSSNVSNALFTVGQPDAGLGLEGIAEDGSFGALEANLAAETGITVPFAPGAFAVYQGANPLFTSGVTFPNNGIEGVAEDGSTDQIAAALSAEVLVRESGVFAQPVGASANGPIGPGGSYQFTFSAQDGDYLNFATMFIQSNDLFYAASNSGVLLFENGAPVSGDITDMIMLWDAGTEENEEPGVGGYQAPRQPGANTGPADSDQTVRIVNDGYTYPMTNQVIRVTIQTL
jgi:hypothetical protein